MSLQHNSHSRCQIKVLFGLTTDSYIDPPRIDEDSTDTTDYKTVLEHIVEDIYCNKAQDVFTSLVQTKQVRRKFIAFVLHDTR